MSGTAVRLITLLMLLQRRPNQKARELAQELGVSTRSVLRYIAMLEEIGIPIYAERGRYGGFSLARSYRMPPMVFTPDEAVAVYLGTSLVGEMWGKLYAEAARGALAKLDNVLPEEQRHEVAWAQRKLVATGLHRSDQEVLAPLLAKLRRAVQQRRSLRMVYEGANRPDPTVRHVDPYALVHRWGWWTVIGYCHLRRAMRSFRVDRIRELVLLDQGFDEPVDFDVQAYLAQEQRLQPQVQVRMRFLPELAWLARHNRAGWEHFEEQEDGAVVVGFSAPDLEWAASTVLSYGGAAAVIEPEPLRQLVRERALVLATQHQRSSQA